MRSLRKVVFLLERVVRPVSQRLNTLGVYVLGVMMCITTIDVVLRYFFNRPLLGSYEVTEYMMAFVVFWGMGYVGIRNAHVSVDIIYRRLRQRTQVILDCFTYPVTAAVCILLTWQAIVDAQYMLRSGSASSVLSIPTFPFVWVAVLGWVVLSLVIILQFLQHLVQVVSK